MTIMTIETAFCRYFIDAGYTEEQEVNIRNIYRNSSDKNKEDILKEISDYLLDEKFFTCEYQEFIDLYGNIGNYPYEYFRWLHHTGDLMSETEFKELEERIEEREGKKALEELRKSPEWRKEVYPDNCSNELYY